MTCSSGRSTRGSSGTSPAASAGGVHVTDVDERLADDAHGSRVAGLGAGAARRGRRARRRCCPTSAPRPRSTGRAWMTWPGCRSRATWATSMPRCSGRPASSRGSASAPTGPAASCSCTRASGRSTRAMASSRPSRAVIGDAPATYALEGSVAIAGALVGWLRDNLGIIGDASEVERLARSVPDSGDVVFVPAFSGLFAPHWRSDARGVIAGLTRYATRGQHRARGARVDRLPGLRPRGGDGGRSRWRPSRRAAGGRRDDPPTSC